ncbi:MAG: hypothetical protein JXA97_06820 [Anaerolineales bacterium]|nr:hypothetical protein [Anaerolineales bacterium]
MAEQRCPMCSKLNPEGVEECAHCGARLTPLIISSQQTPGSQPESGGETPDWLARIRSDVEASKDQEPEPEDGGDADDWLGRLRSAGAEQVEPEPGEEVPAWISARAPDESVDQKAPEWLSRIRKREQTLREKAGSQEKPAESGDWLASLREKTGEQPAKPAAKEDWLSALRETTAGDDEDTSPEMPEPIQELRDLADVLPLDEIPPAEPSTVDEVPPREQQSKDVPEADQDWLDAFQDEAFISSEAEEQSPADGSPDFLPVEMDSGGLEAEDISDEDIFAALDALDDSASLESEPSLGVAFREIKDVEWIDATDLVGEGPDITPAYPPEPVSQHTPALITEDQIPPSTGDSQDHDLEAIDLPDWLGELQETGAEPAQEVSRKDQNLAPATLPAWLEAMRPIDTFRSSVEIEPVDDQAVESAGPLAGLRGVLMAEPVVAIPHQASVGSGRLDISERQFAQAELLHRMVDDEERELPLESRPRRQLPFVRWAIAALMILAILGAIVTASPGTTSFPPPVRVPQDLAPLFALVDELPSDKPALLVFDYSPGYTAEFDAVASVILEHLMRRDIAITTVSTQVSGPLLAERMIQRIGRDHDLVNGVDYIHLGYLSGGPTAVQLFAAAPRESILRGFLLPEELEGQSAWLSVILNDVQRLSDFGVVAVITAGTDNARVWAEQAHPWMGDTPLLMVLSTGAEPLVRPYYESLDPQVEGILTGLPEAVAYEQMNARPADALARWDGFNASMLVVEAVLLAGSMYGLMKWLLKPRRS